MRLADLIKQVLRVNSKKPRPNEPIWLGRKRGSSDKGATTFWNKGTYRKPR